MIGVIDVIDSVIDVILNPSLIDINIFKIVLININIFENGLIDIDIFNDIDKDTDIFKNDIFDISKSFDMSNTGHRYRRSNLNRAFSKFLQCLMDCLMHALDMHTMKLMIL